MKKETVIASPVFRSPLEQGSLKEIEEEERIEDRCFTGEEIAADISDESFFSCTFDNVIFTADQRGLLFTDVKFHHCDFSNIRLSETVMHRCVFDSCRFTGCDLSTSVFEDVICKDSILSYANFSGSKMNRFAIRDCQADHSAFSNCRFAHIFFQNTRFTEAEFLNTPLKDVDFSTCDIAGFSVNINQLRGAVMNEEQAAACAAMLGIRIKSY